MILFAWSVKPDPFFLSGVFRFVFVLSISLDNDLCSGRFEYCLFHDSGFFFLLDAGKLK